MHCPACNGVDVGKVGSNQYYCWHCFLEFNVSSRSQVKYYYVQEDGSLLQLQKPEDRLQLEEFQYYLGR